MKPEVYWYTLLGSLAGGLAGALVMWHRQSRTAAFAPTSPGRRSLVLLGGTGAIGCAVFAFGKAFGTDSPLHGPIVTVLVTAWISVVGSVIHLPGPRRFLRALPAESAWLRSPWSGVPAFGALLRRTPLRHLGGRVYLAAAGGDLQAALEDLRAAERLHLWALVASLPWIVAWGIHGQWAPMLGALLVHLPLNVFPVLHLRRAIARTERCQHRTERRPGVGRHPERVREQSRRPHARVGS